MGKTNRKEKGAVMIVEATIVFPIVFAIVFLMIYLGNAFYLKAKVDQSVTRYAIKGASYCADPYLQDKLPTKSVGIDIMPYRYIFQGFSESIEAELVSAIKGELNGDTGVFKNTSTNISCDAEYNPALFYSSFTVNVKLTVNFPIKLLNTSVPLFVYNAREEMPVIENASLIRDVDYVQDIFESTKAGEKFKKIADTFNNLEELLSKIPGMED